MPVKALIYQIQGIYENLKTKGYKMKDHILRASAADNEIRAFAISGKNLIEKAKGYHNLTPLASAALGRSLLGASMMGVMMKGEDDRLTLIFKGDGPINGVTVCADSKGIVKGYVGNPDVNMELNYLNKLDVGGAIGYGTLTVIKDLGLKEPYTSTINLTTSEVAEDLTYYFATSEQTPSAVALGVLVDTDCSIKQAGGFIIQLMPNASEKTIDILEENLKNITSITALLEEGLTTKDILNKVLENLNPVILDTINVDFVCDCSKERIENAIAAIGKNDLEEMINENKEVEVSCHFCNKKYTLSVDELKNLLNNK